MYAEVLYALTHALKIRDQSESDSLVEHLQEIFKMEEKKHQRMLKVVKTEKVPKKFKFLNFTAFLLQNFLEKEKNVKNIVT